jgi:hypothetical protein
VSQAFSGRWPNGGGRRASEIREDVFDACRKVALRSLFSSSRDTMPTLRDDEIHADADDNDAS